MIETIYYDCPCLEPLIQWESRQEEQGYRFSTAALHLNIVDTLSINKWGCPICIGTGLLPIPTQEIIARLPPSNYSVPCFLPDNCYSPATFGLHYRMDQSR